MAIEKMLSCHSWCEIECRSSEMYPVIVAFATYDEKTKVAVPELIET